MRYAAMGVKGRKNCRVMGNINEERRRVATAVLTRGPGYSIMLSEKMPTTAKNSHCPS
jgi:hypothetical protein